MKEQSKIRTFSAPHTEIFFRSAGLKMRPMCGIPHVLVTLGYIIILNLDFLGEN